MNKFLPLVLFVILAWFLYDGLGRNTQKLPSPLIGQTFPNIEVEDFYTGEKYASLDKLKNHISLVNVWASWCVTCHVEHSMLNKISKTNLVQMVGINYKDNAMFSSTLRGKKSQKCSYETRDDTKFGDCFLSMRGNPFEVIIFDEFGKLGLELGVYRVPETFLINQKGVIIYKHLGEITPFIWENEIKPLVQSHQKNGL